MVNIQAINFNQDILLNWEELSSLSVKRVQMGMLAWRRVRTRLESIPTGMS